MKMTPDSKIIDTCSRNIISGDTLDPKKATIQSPPLQPERLIFSLPFYWELSWYIKLKKTWKSDSYYAFKNTFHKKFEKAFKFLDKLQPLSSGLEKSQEEQNQSRRMDVSKIVGQIFHLTAAAYQQLCCFLNNISCAPQWATKVYCWSFNDSTL